MNAQRFLGASTSTISAAALMGSLLLGVQTATAQIRHPIAAHRVHVHRVHERRENVAGVRQGRVEGVQERRENVAGVRQERVESVRERRAAGAVARAVLPPHVPATLVASGSIVQPPVAATLPTTTVAPPPAVVPSAEEYDGLHSDAVPDVFEGSTSYPVDRIENDGVTVVLKVDNGETRVRLVGVSAVTLGERANVPERLANMRLPSTQNFIENLLKGETVYVVYDTRVAEEDADHKVVAYLFRAPDGLMVNQEVIRAGFAVTDTGYDFDQKELFTHYQELARKAGKGIYGIVQRMKAARSERQ